MQKKSNEMSCRLFINYVANALQIFKLKCRVKEICSVFSGVHEKI